MSIEKGHTMVDNNLHRKRKIEQHEHHKKNQGRDQNLSSLRNDTDSAKLLTFDSHPAR
jgi:hypothetical protein